MDRCHNLTVIYVTGGYGIFKRMQIETGLAVVIVAVLIFYLRLIVLQRERARRLRVVASVPDKRGKGKNRQNAEPPKYGILSPKPLDRAIGIAGAAGVVLGVLMYAGVFRTPAVESYWWIPTSAGIVAFSWMFKL